MLARNFLTAKELGLSDDVYQAHVKLLSMMERGELKESTKYVKEPKPNTFCMEDWACCIRGWAGRLGVKVDRCTFEQWELYTGYRDFTDYKVPTMAQAIHALQNFLTRGRADWRAVMQR